MIIGIDPGKTGGIATRFLDGRMEIIPMPETTQAIIHVLGFHGKQIRHVFIEKSASRPGQGVVSMFNYGVHFGTLLGIIAALHLPHTPVPPATWAKVMHAGTAIGDTKIRSLEAALRLFPELKWMASPKCKKAHMGMVEAALICEYGRRTLGMSA